MAITPMSNFANLVVKKNNWRTASPLSKTIEERARLCLLDWLGCAIAGAASPDVRKARQVIFENGVADTGRLARLDKGACPRQVAMFNGLAGHFLDFDDTHFPSETHPGTVIWPAVLALAERDNLFIEDILPGFIFGLDVLGALGSAMNPEHYGRAWHATGTLGAIGAAAAVARTSCLNDEEASCAIEHAALQMSGMQASFGSIAKPLNAGRAASTGLLAVQLSKAGFQISSDVFEARGGVFELMGCEKNTPIESNEISEVFRVIFKKFPSCFSTHSAIEAAVALYPNLRPTDEIVRSVIVTLSEYALDQVAIRAPISAHQARFSVSYCVASALVFGDVNVEIIEDPIAIGDEVRNLEGAIQLASDNNLANFEASVRITLHNGQELVEKVLIDPEETSSISTEDIYDKFQKLATPILSAKASANLQKQVMQGSNLRIADIMGQVVGN